MSLQTNKYQKRTRRTVAVFLLCCLAFTLLACGNEPGEADTGGLQIALMPAPGGMAGETLSVQLTDADGAPVTDATVTVEGNMNHAGMVPIMTDAVTDDADGTRDGIYQFPFQFSMLGDWIITVSVEQADSTTVTRDIEATVGENGVTVEEPFMADGAAATMDHSEMDHGETDHGETDHSEMDHEEMMAEYTGQLMVYDVFARPAPIAGGTGGVYLSIHNDTDRDVQLTGVETAIATASELHETINDNNVMRMEHRPDGFAIPAGEMLRLEPGGKHIMLIDLSQPLAEGDTFTLTLTFANADAMALEVTVGAMDGSMPMGDHAMDAMADETPVAND